MLEEPARFDLLDHYADLAERSCPAGRGELPPVRPRNLEEIDPGLGVVQPVAPGQLAELRPGHLRQHVVKIRLQRLALAGQQRKGERADHDADRICEPARRSRDDALDQAKTEIGDHDGSRTGCIGEPGFCGACSVRQTGRKTSHWSGSRRMIRSKNCTMRSVVTWISRWVSPVRLTSMGASTSAM